MTRPPIQCDTLIIGAGLAGSILAWKLQQAGQSIHLIHQPSIQSASRVAAGLINPVTGQRLVLQKNIAQYLPAAHSFYQQLSQRFKQDFFIVKPMLRQLNDDKIRLAWHKRQHDKKYHGYLSQSSEHPDAILQHQTGYLDTNALLNALQAKFKQQSQITEAHFHHQNLSIHNTHLQWSNIRASKVIFCQGWRAKFCHFFSFLPFQPAKGEILTLSSSTKLPKHIINQHKWLLPMNDYQCKLGATYENNFDNEAISSDARKELLQALKEMPVDHKSMTVTQQQAGIRPNSLDKSPFLGSHPKHKNIHIFNGFGSKGSLLIPWHAQAMCDYLIHHKKLPDEADIQRFTCD
ncbi:MAG: FAD-dependent oxidoreductase [Mariprofundaceae bacterium]